MDIHLLKGLSINELYKNELSLNLFLKNVNISSRVINKKNKRSEELYNKFMQRQNRTEKARINKEIKSLEKIKKIEKKHINGYFNEINNRYKSMNKEYDNIRKSEISNYFINNNNGKININKWQFLSQIKLK